MKISVLLTLSILLAHLSYSEPDFIMLSDSVTSDSGKVIYLNNEVVVVGNRYQTNAFHKPKAVAFLNVKQLQQLSSMSTPDAMANIAGVWMQKTNHGGGSPFIRGLTGYQTLLMIDGIRLNNSTFRSGPNQYLNTIDPLMLERIEVERGAGSVAYGTDAIGGTALFLTKDPNFSPDGFQVEGGVYGKNMTSDMEKSGRVDVNLAGKKVAVYGGITYKDLGDVKAGGNLGTLSPTGYTEFSGDVKAKLKLNENQLVTAAFQHLKQNDVPLYHKVVPGDYQQYDFDPQERGLGYLRLESFYDHPVFSVIRYTVSYQESFEGRTKQKSGSSIISREEDRVKTFGAGIEIISNFSNTWKASSGIEFYRDVVNSLAFQNDEEEENKTFSRGLYPDGSTAGNFAIYSQHQIEKGKFNFDLGVRFNAFQLMIPDEKFGEAKITPEALVGNFGITYKVHKNHHLFGSMNSAFRAPNINDVSSFGIADFRYEIPNYDLKPEKSLNVELGYKTRLERFSAAIYFYQNNLTDLITNVRATYNGVDSLDGVQVYQRENVNEAKIQGFETELEWAISQKIVAFGNLTYAKGQNISKNEPMRRIPPLFGRAGLRTKFIDQFYLNGEWVFASAQTRLSGGDKDDNRIAEGGTPAWNVVNFYAGYAFPKWRVNAGFQNVFNEAYRVHGSGIDGVGRSLWVSFKIDI
ncbi:MAG: TonB-dependent receptor [Flammeovirgaceae bacterium]|nr:TonB-dependent receptor [Flammeovirgaceae bacterium]